MLTYGPRQASPQLKSTLYRQELSTRMKIWVGILFLTLTALPSAQATTETSCSLEAPWDRTRELLAELSADSESRPVESIDDGRLFEAVTAWTRARMTGDVDALEQLTIRLPIQYADVNRRWIASEVGGQHIWEAKVVTARLDDTNPFHVVVFVEAATRIGGRCSVTSIATSWVKLDGKWQALPGGGYIQ